MKFLLILICSFTLCSCVSPQLQQDAIDQTPDTTIGGCNPYTVSDARISPQRKGTQMRLWKYENPDCVEYLRNHIRIFQNGYPYTAVPGFESPEDLRACWVDHQWLEC